MRLDPWLQRTLYAIVGILFATGAAWFIGGQFTEFSRAEPWQEISPYLLMLHGGAAMAFLLLLGALGAIHIRVTWRTGKNRPLGIAMLVINALLIVTAFGLYYIGSEKLRQWTSDLHVLVGFGYPVLLVLHIFVGRRTIAAAANRMQRKPQRLTLT